MQYQHANCGGLIKNCPANDEAFCDHCGKWIDESAIINQSIEQGSSKMTQANDDFELTNCPDPNCFICVTMPKGGYPSASQIEDGRVKLSDYHKKKLSDGLVVLLSLAERAA